MEVASELLLKANGRFEYMLANGALDELASRLRRDYGAITLRLRDYGDSLPNPHLQLGTLKSILRPLASRIDPCVTLS